MKEIDKNKRRSPYPPNNISANYYTDPVYSTDAFYGFEEEEMAEELVLTEDLGEETGKDKEVLDEPVESWGWINNVD